MKNIFFKIFAILLLLPSLTSCHLLRQWFGREPYVWQCNYDDVIKYDVKLGVRSDSVIVNVTNGLTLTFGFGHYDIPDQYLNRDMSEYKVAFYVGHSSNINPDSDNTDYRYLREFYLLKTIADFETFCTDKYRYTTDYINMTTYNYEESITIPREVLLTISNEAIADGYCGISLKLMTVERKNNLDDSVSSEPALTSGISVYFDWLDEKTIELGGVSRLQ